MIPGSRCTSGSVLPAERALRAHHLRLTMPRRVVLDVVRSADTHPTAAFVFERVRRRLPRVGLGTVYNNLQRLVAAGLLQKRVAATELRFDPNLEPHDHFTCVACERIFDLPRHDHDRRRRSTAPRDERVRTARRMGFEVLESRVELCGRCRDCRRRGRTVRSTSGRTSRGVRRSSTARAPRRRTVRAR